MDNEKGTLTVHDDGKGFDVEPSSQDHQGLHGMRERLELVGGQLTIESSSEVGTKLRAIVPKQPRTIPGESYERTI